MSIRNLFLLSFICLSISACSHDVFLTHNGNMPSEDKISQIAVGQHKTQVGEILGSPSSISSFDNNTWIYMSSTTKQIAFCKPEEIARQVLTISFDDKGLVSKISNYSQKDGKVVTIDESETITEGNEQGFFEKYFGGVGAYMPIAPTNSGENM